MVVQSQGPDLFELTCDETRITFVPAASGGAPRVQYSGPLGEHAFEGDELQLHESARGLEVSFSVDTHLQTVTLTVFVPELELDDAPERHFHTVGIHATQRRTIAGGPGAIMTAAPLEVEGVARLLEYGATGPTLL
ncbi:MAG: hypothetical protein QOG15_2234 [Solirubrobacteraceae bacterium]|jgi:hypothetical protein|nr:hypothetical protein [Solirubrobacteraceae bacterium]